MVRVEGREYGPVDTDALREWRSEGRLIPANEVRRVGEEHWIPAGELPEIFGDAEPATPPALDRTSRRRKHGGKFSRKHFEFIGVPSCRSCSLAFSLRCRCLSCSRPSQRFRCPISPRDPLPRSQRRWCLRFAWSCSWCATGLAGFHGRFSDRGRRHSARSTTLVRSSVFCRGAAAGAARWAPPCWFTGVTSFGSSCPLRP